VAELLFWPALLFYSEAAVAYFGNVRRPGLYGRVATWGVRIGWLVQTALLVYQALHADGFPWDTWAGALNLLVWLVVGAYLIWGCRARFRLLGLAVMPVAVALLALARAGGGTGSGEPSRSSTAFLVIHVGLVLAAFAGFTLAAALSGLYLWQERRLKRREAAILRVRAPSLLALESLATRTVAVALAALTLGIAVALARIDGFDALIAVTLLAWVVYAAFLGLRLGAGWRGRRAAYVALVGFVFVVAAWLAFPVGHLA
jgi:ABC-type uncharacterized transport system permease subunit